MNGAEDSEKQDLYKELEDISGEISEAAGDLIDDKYNNSKVQIRQKLEKCKKDLEFTISRI